MKKTRFCAFFIALTVTAAALLAPSASAASMYPLPEGQTLHAQGALVAYLGLTPEQDTILFEKEADGLFAPSALVTLMTAAYALKLIKENHIDMDTATGVYTKELFDTYIAGTGLSTGSMDYVKGEAWTIRDLLTTILLMTAGDAAVTLAAALSPTGKVPDFVQGMNDLAAEIGCEHTLFANVTGIGSLSQFTTPRDMYRILRYALDFPEFKGLVENEQHTIKPASNGRSWTAVTANYMKRRSSSYYYEPMVFGRTGRTDQGAWNLASMGQSGGYDYIVIVLGCPAKAADGTANLHYVDTQMLYKWAFSQFTYKPLLTKNDILAQVKVNLAWNKDKVALVPKEDYATVVYNQLKSEDIIKKITLSREETDAPVSKGDVFGKAELFVNLDQKIGEVELVAAETVERSQVLAAWEKVRGFLESPWFYLGLGLLALLLAGYILLNVIHNRNRRKKKMQKLGRFE